jgi:hypothetical protein
MRSCGFGIDGGKNLADQLDDGQPQALVLALTARSLLAFSSDANIVRRKHMNGTNP